MIKKHLGKIVAGVAILLGLIAVLLIFAPAIVPKSQYKDLAGDDANISGWDIAFGAQEEGVSTYVASAYMLAFILPLVGVILAVVALLGKGGKIVPIIAAVCFLAGGIVYFLPLDTISMNKDLVGDNMATIRDAMKLSMTAGAGAIVGGIFSILAAAASCATLFIKKN